MTCRLYSVHPDVHAVTLDGEVVVYVPATGSLHVLAGTAAVVWHLLAQEVSLPALTATVCALVEAPPPDVAETLAGLAAGLHGLGLLRAGDQP